MSIIPWRKYWMNLRDGFRRAFADDPWDVEPASLPWWQGRLVEGRRILRLIIKGFREDNCPLHAAALTYNTLLALIPMMAVGLWILRGVGAAEMAEKRILESIRVMPPEFQSFIEDTLSYVENTDFNTLGGIGLLFLMWLAITVLARVETSFNKIWAVQISRGFLRKSADYISILVVVPILIITATTINAAMSSEWLTNYFELHTGLSSDTYLRLLSITPWVGVWMAMTFINVYIPNTRVRFGPGLISGLIGGSLWFFWQLLYLRFQFGIARYNAIYGTFASVPIFLAWVYISWQIVLLSAEVAFAVQHRNSYRREHDTGLDLRSRFLLMLAVLVKAANALRRHQGPFDSDAFADAQAIPARMVNSTVSDLVRTGYLIEVSEPRGAVVLLRSPETIRLRDLATGVILAGSQNGAAPTDVLPEAFKAAWRQLESGLTQALGETTLLDFIQNNAFNQDHTAL